MSKEARHRAPGALAFAAVFVAGSAALGLVGAALVPVGNLLATGTTDYELPAPRLGWLAQRSVVLDRNGRQMAFLFRDQNRATVRLAEISKTLQRAVLAAEDRNFFAHGAIDWRGVFRALGKNLDAGKVLQGGSTITQQVAKNTLFDEPKRDLKRKLREAVLATALERQYSKPAIFQRYLNTVYFGQGAYGVRAAAERYFGKAPSALNLAESALLAALIANPEGREPVNHPADAARWRSYVLDEMVKAKWATPAAAEAARAAPLPERLFALPTTPSEEPFVEEVKRRLLDDPRLGETRTERYHLLFEGGLRIHTTFDPGMQAAAEIAVRASVPDSVPYTAALVAIDNRDGSVRAVVPGSQYRRAGFDLAIQGLRQTGSAFKAITVTAALENGFSPEDRVYAGSRCTFDMGRYAKPWNVRNYDGASYGTLTLTKALAVSSNCAFARVALALGPEKIADMGRRLGITHHLEPVPSMTLGTNAVSPLDMATALSTIAADGVHHEPRFYTTVESRHGDVLIADEPTGEQVIDPQVARTATDMLTHVVTEGTGRRAGLEHPVAGKTGTNQQYRDAWFVGFTAQLTTAVWIGNPDAQVPIVINGSRVTGGLYPAQIWHDFMEAAMQGEPLVSFVPPDETLWPRAGSITERGRNVAAPRPVPIPESTTTTSAPASEEKHRRGRSERQAPPTSTASPSTTSPPTSTPATTSPTASPPDPPAADGGT